MEKGCSTKPGRACGKVFLLFLFMLVGIVNLPAFFKFYLRFSNFTCVLQICQVIIDYLLRILGGSELKTE
jgi:hypothetical protein